MDKSANIKENLKYLASLTHFREFGPARLKRLKKHFPQWENAFNASLAGLVSAGIEESIASEFITARASINADEIMEKLDREHIHMAVPEDPEYPSYLKEAADHPELLYYIGRLLPSEPAGLAVVGTRKLSGYGASATQEIVKGLSGSGLTIVSGLALGIDTIAHTAALDAKLRTIAVLGTGLDRKSIYPSANLSLAERIVAEGGAVISEFPLATPPLKMNFPQRNRIVAGMTRGTLVVEADEKSGALITARLALDYNREVMAVPGSIYSGASRGTNAFLKQGAKLVLSAADVLEVLNISKETPLPAAKNMVPSTPEESLILETIEREPRHINELVRLTRLDTSQINSTLAIMEMKGMIRNLGNMTYVSIK